MIFIYRKYSTFIESKYAEINLKLNIKTNQY